MMNEELKKELGELGSSLKNLDQKVKHKIPAGYFEEMQDELIQKMKEFSSQPVKRKIPFRRYLYSAAAVVLLMIAAIFVWNQQKSGSTGFDDLDAAAIYAYLDENIEEINMNMLLSEEVAAEEIFIDDQDASIEEYLEENLDDLSIEDLEDIL